MAANVRRCGIDGFVAIRTPFLCLSVVGLRFRFVFSIGVRQVLVAMPAEQEGREKLDSESIGLQCDILLPDPMWAVNGVVVVAAALDEHALIPCLVMVPQ